jgi:hypothetical protein
VGYGGEAGGGQVKDWQADKASGGTPESRNREAKRILFDLGLKDASFERDKDSDFVAGLVDRFERFGDKTIISSLQLFWLRDLVEKCL